MQMQFGVHISALVFLNLKRARDHKTGEAVQTAFPMATAAPPSDRESRAAGAEEEGTSSTTTWRSFPTDVFMDILLRLPPSNRRWVRLVCRHWRAVIDERTPPQQRSKPALLACFTSPKSASAYVIDDLEMGWCRQVWGVRADPNATNNRDGRRKDIDVTMVGTCNGLLCLCDNTKHGGAIALLNPATRETMRLPPLPVCHRGGRWSGYGSWKAYSFGFHPMTGRYTVLHLPCRADATGGFTSLQVFTLGDPSWAWRDVPVSFPGVDGTAAATTCTCSVDAGLITVDGATYWVTKDAGRVTSFDHEQERVTLAAPLPVVGGPGSGYVLRLVEAHGRLGLAVCADRWGPVKTEVWVLGRQGWSRQYSVQVQEAVWQRLAGPHFAHGGYVLTVNADNHSLKHVFAHRVRDADATGRLQSGEVRSLRIKEQGTVAAYCKDGYYLRTFAYVETTEPLLSDFKRRQQVQTKLSS